MPMEAQIYPHRPCSSRCDDLEQEGRPHETHHIELFPSLRGTRVMGFSGEGSPKLRASSSLDFPASTALIALFAVEASQDRDPLTLDRLLPLKPRIPSARNRPWQAPGTLTMGGEEQSEQSHHDDLGSAFWDAAVELLADPPTQQ